MITPDTPLFEDVLRFVRREAGSLDIGDLLLVLIADALQYGMVGNYSSLTNAIIIGATLVFWSYLLTTLGYRFPRVRRILKPAPMLLIRDGHIQESAARRMLPQDEILSLLRSQGMTQVGGVAAAYVDSSEQVRVLPEPDRLAGERKTERDPGPV